MVVSESNSKPKKATGPKISQFCLDIRSKSSNQRRNAAAFDRIARSVCTRAGLPLQVRAVTSSEGERGPTPRDVPCLAARPQTRAPSSHPTHQHQTVGSHHSMSGRAPARHDAESRRPGKPERAAPAGPSIRGGTGGTRGAPSQPASAPTSSPASNRTVSDVQLEAMILQVRTRPRVGRLGGLACYPQDTDCVHVPRAATPHAMPILAHTTPSS